MPCNLPYWRAILIAHDQLFNAFLNGWPDETISSRAYRWRKNGIRKWPEKAINAIFFLDRKNGKGHCELSFESEREGRQMPPEARADINRSP